MPISTIFRQICSMSLTAGICIVVILLIRFPLRKAPKIFSYALWSVALFRLLCPISFESVLSIIPSTQVVEPTGQSGLPFQVTTNIPAIDTPVNHYLGDHYYEGVTVPTGFSLDISRILAWIWLTGCVLLVGASMVSLIRLRKKLRGAVFEEKNIYRAKGLETAFVLGIFRPKIYLPEGLSQKERRYILLHEQTHIRRKDYLIRLLAFLALCIHWFNPLVWIAFFISSRDMEMSCDESVLKKLGNEVKKDYSASLLSLASGRRWVSGTPLAFGEGDTKSRIKNVLSYRKPAFWVLIAAILGVAAAVFLLAANPLEKRESMRWLNSLNPEEVQQIELVVMPSGEKEQYTLYTDKSDISAIVSLLREGKGRYVANPENLAGGGSSFYFTMQDGSRHSVSNNGNTYLVVDGDSYDADYDWLSSWEKDYGRGNDPLPENFSFDTTASPFGQQYMVESILYHAPQYSADIAVDGAPRYQLTQEGNLLESTDWILGNPDSGDWADCGPLEKISLTSENFDQLFSFADETVWKNGFSVQLLQKDVQSVWKAVRKNGEDSILYYVLQQKNGSLFLTYGYENEESSNIRWVFRLYPEAYFQSEIAENLFALRTDYVGNASAVGKILDALEFPDKRDGFSLQTNTEPYGLTVNFPETELESFPYEYEKNAVLLLALIDNLDTVSFQYSGGYGGVYTRDWAEEWTGLTDVRAHSVEELSSLLAVLEQKAADYQTMDAEASTYSEAQYLQDVLNTVEFTEEGMKLSLPDGMPTIHPLSVQASKNSTFEDGSQNRQNLIDNELVTFEEGIRSKQGWDIDIGGWKEGDSVSIYLRFYEQKDENTISETANWYASWIYQDGEMVRQPWQPETQLRSWSQEKNGETFLNFREPYGIDFTLSLTLPEGWTVEPTAGILTGGETQILDETGQTMGTIVPSSFTYYPEAAGENFPVSVYSDLMLSSVTNWNNAYTPVKQGPKNADGIAVTETATVLMQHTDNGAAGPMIEKPGILSYNLEILRYVAISFEESVPQETAKTIAQSIVLE